MITKDDLVKMRGVVAMAFAAYDDVIAHMIRRETTDHVGHNMAVTAAMDKYAKANLAYDKALWGFFKEVEVLPAAMDEYAKANLAYDKTLWGFFKQVDVR